VKRGNKVNTQATRSGEQAKADDPPK